MSEYELYLLMAVIGQVLPPVTDVLNKHVASEKVRFWSSMLVAVIFAIGANYHNLKYGSLSEALITALIVWTSGQTAYQQWYSGSKWQMNVRFNNSRLPIKELIPPMPSMPRFGKSSVETVEPIITQ